MDAAIDGMTETGDAIVPNEGTVGKIGTDIRHLFITTHRLFNNGSRS